MHKLALTMLVTLLLVLPARAAEKIQVVASFSILGDMAAEIAGDKADILVLVGPNGDAHAFEPSPADAKKLSDSKLVLVNGLGLDGWMERLVAASGYTGPVVVASKGIEPRTMIEEEHGHREPVTDPHAWQDLSNGIVYVSNIVDALAKADPANAGDYRARGDRYIAKLRALDADIRREIAKVPPAKRRVITSHDAFGYFAGAYGVEFLAPEGISTEAEPSATDLARLIDQIKREGIKTLFVENITDPRMIKMIAGETAAEIGGTLFSDATSPPDGPAPHYMDMFTNNVPRLVAAMLKN
jgi:zinc/manganese transport system substrate-binding protein